MPEKPRIILHLLERQRRGRYCAGQWKDIESFNEILASLDNQFYCLEFDHSEIKQLAERCRDVKASDIILYYSFLPEVLMELRTALPEARLFVRTVNAEACQHWQRAEINLTPNYSNLRAIYGAARLAWRDSQCKQIAHGLLGISRWDNQTYWDRLPGRARVYEVPYLCPWPALRPHVKPLCWDERKDAIVCLAGGRDAIGRTMLEGFNALADQLGNGEAFHDWEFSLSPGILNTERQLKLSSYVRRMQSLEEPWDLLCSVRALAVLTPLGFGCKTTVVDALVAGCHVLVHPKLAVRLPSEIAAHCIVFDPEENTDAFTIRRLLTQEPSGRQLNEVLRVRATRELKSIFDNSTSNQFLK